MKRFLFTVLFFVVIGFSAKWAYAQGGDDLNGESISTIGFRPPVIMVADPNLQNIKVPTIVQWSELDAASATFVIDYVANGETDYRGETCVTFPEDAKAAFNAAATIWAHTIHSITPITIKACWADLVSPTTLGYSGTPYVYANYPGLPLADTFYGAALANSFFGHDETAGVEDMYITYNQNFSWYYGLDANPGTGEYDLVTVAAHEIAHGLGFSGSARYDYQDSTWKLGYYGYPEIYDIFIENGAGTKITSLMNSSATLEAALTSNDLWFNGTNANIANSRTRVKIYAPSTWSDGSSYSHLDYDTFKYTEHNMMVYAIGDGSANHNPGIVTLGLLEDMGWEVTYPTPANDEFNSAITVSLPAGLQDTRFTSGATTNISDPEINQCGITGKGNGSVWYKYTPGANETVAFNTVGSDFDTFIVVWEGTTVNTLTFVTCDKGGEATAGFQATGGDVYYIEVGKP